MMHLMFSINHDLLIVKCHLGNTCMSAEINSGGIVTRYHYVNHPAKVSDYERAGWEIREI